MVMENKASFFARLEPRLAASELTRIRGAYLMAKFGHRAQVRKELGDDGNPLRYFEHVRRVALVLMDEAKCHDPDLVCTALLLDEASMRLYDALLNNLPPPPVPTSRRTRTSAAGAREARGAIPKKPPGRTIWERLDDEDD